MELMLHCDLVAIASIYEGLPTVLLEALSIGIPVVSTDVGRARELIGASSGVVVGRSPAEFADGISRSSRLSRRATEEAAIQLRPLLGFRHTADMIFELAQTIAAEESQSASMR